MLLTKSTNLFPMGLDRWFQELWEPEQPFSEETFVPNVDLFEDKEGYTVQVELAGLNPKDVKLETDGNLLTLRGEKRWEDEKKERQYYRMESRYGSFLRQISLPESADVRKASATHKDGVLVVRLPKKEEACKNTVQIEVK